MPRRVPRLTAMLRGTLCGTRRGTLRGTLRGTRVHVDRYRSLTLFQRLLKAAQQFLKERSQPGDQLHIDTACRNDKSLGREPRLLTISNYINCYWGMRSRGRTRVESVLVDESQKRNRSIAPSLISTSSRAPR